jgi:hypothetical protein
MQAFIFSWPPRTPDMKREFKDLEEAKRLPKGTVVGKSIFDSA